MFVIYEETVTLFDENEVGDVCYFINGKMHPNADGDWIKYYNTGYTQVKRQTPVKKRWRYLCTEDENWFKMKGISESSNIDRVYYNDTTFFPSYLGCEGGFGKLYIQRFLLEKE